MKENAWQPLASQQKLAPTKAHGTNAVGGILMILFLTYLPKSAYSTKWLFLNLYILLLFFCICC